jgi:hypothetical protein
LTLPLCRDRKELLNWNCWFELLSFTRESTGLSLQKHNSVTGFNLVQCNLRCYLKCLYSFRVFPNGVSRGFKYVRFTVLTAVKMFIVTQRGIADGYQRSGGTLPRSSGLKMDVGCTTKTLLLTKKSTWCHKPEDQ